MITNHYAKILAFLQTFKLHSGVFQVKCLAFLTSLCIMSAQRNKLDH